MGESLINELITKKILISIKNRLQLFNKVDISMYGARAWTLTIQTLGDKKNEKYLFDLGYIMGYDSAQELNDILKKMKSLLPEKLMVITNLIEMAGFGVIKIDDHVAGKKITLEVIENHIIDYANEFYGNKSKVCSFYAGVYSGFVNVFLDFKDCKFIEKKCKCKSEEKCIFEYNKK